MRCRQLEIAFLAMVTAALPRLAIAEDESNVRGGAGKTITVESPHAVSATAQIVGCDNATKTDYPKEPGQLVTALNWHFKVFVSDNDGLVLREISLGPRYMAEDIRLPYYLLSVPGLYQERCELKPNSQNQNCRSRLVLFSIETSDPEVAEVRATYAVDRVPSGDKRCLLIEQKYQFFKEHSGIPYHCEPFAEASCARFKPVISYAVNDNPVDPKFQIWTVQRLHFLVDGRVSRAAVGIECDVPLATCKTLNPTAVIKMTGGNPIEKEWKYDAIDGGQKAGADHFHQSPLKHIHEPGLTHFGCAECVHVHWRWSARVKDVGLLHPLIHGGPQFGRWGEPLVPSGSKQSVLIGVTGELLKDPQDWERLIKQRSLEGSSPVLYYQATSKARSDEFFGHGGFFSSYGLNLLEWGRGGNIATVTEPGRKPLGRRYPAWEFAILTLDGGKSLDLSEDKRLKVGTDIVYHFLDQQSATFNGFCMTIDPSTAAVNIRRFQLFTGDKEDGPWTQLGDFEAPQTPLAAPSKRSGLVTNCQEFSIPSTTARYLKLHIASGWSKDDRTVVGRIRLYGVLNQE